MTQLVIVTTNLSQAPVHGRQHWPSPDEPSLALSLMKYADAFAADGKTPLAGDDLFSSRGEHLLHFEEADRAADWRKALPELA